MASLPTVTLTWRGHETVDHVAELLADAGRIEVTLPAETNHALFRTLAPGAAPSAPEYFDVVGGPDILRPLAAIAGLEALDALADHLDASGHRVRVTSPPTVRIEPAPDT